MMRDQRLLFGVRVRTSWHQHTLELGMHQHGSSRTTTWSRRWIVTYCVYHGAEVGLIMLNTWV